MEKQQLIEKAADKLGVPGVKVEWRSFSSGGAQTDALLSGNVDIVNTGVGNLLLLWDRTKGGIKGIVANSALPLTLISRDPKIQRSRTSAPTTRSPCRRSAFRRRRSCCRWRRRSSTAPTTGTSSTPTPCSSAIPDAAAMLANPKGEVVSHFSAPPFSAYELKNVTGAHVVAQSPDIIGGPLTQSQFFTTTKFAEANPKIIEAIRIASDEAIEFINKDTPAAVDIYREIAKDKNSREEILESMKQPGMMDYGTKPQGTMKFAAHLYKTGTLKTLPKAWTDYYLPSSSDLDGN